MTYCRGKTREKARAAMKEMNTLKENRATPPTILFAHRSGKAMEHIPQVKDRFRVMHHQKGEENFLGSAHRSWVFGTVTRVIKKKKPTKPKSDWKPYILSLKLDDGRKNTRDFPSLDVQLLIVDYVTDSAFAEMEDGSRVLAYHRDTTKLAMGDLVDCLYQGGVENGACFRGRVAAIDLEKNTCDVLYFDRDYERSVPIDAANLCIVEQGQSTPTWLEGLKVPADFKNMDTCARKGPNKRGSGKIVKFDQRGNGQDKELILKIAFPGGRFESATYSEVVPAIFAAIFESTEAAKIKLWPAALVSTSRSSRTSRTNESCIPQSASARSVTNCKEEHELPHLQQMHELAHSQEVRQDSDDDEEEESKGGWQDEVVGGFRISSR